MLRFDEDWQTPECGSAKLGTGGSARAICANRNLTADDRLDADRDGSIALGGSEGGATQAQSGAQNMGTYNPRESAALPATGGVNWTLFAIITLAAGAVLVTAGGLALRRGRTTA